MSTGTKHISIAGRAATEMLEVEQKVLRDTGLTTEQLFCLKLDIGMRFAEQFSRIFISNRQHIYTNLVHNEQWGFWDWWQLKWSQDDRLIMAIGAPFTNYEQKKEAMIGEDLLTKDLYWTTYKHTDEL